MYFIPYYILILGVLIVVDFFAAKYIEGRQGVQRKAGLIVSIITTCLVLFVFKYFNFFMSGINAVAEGFSLHRPIPLLSIALPIGLSFHTFQSLSYVIEVYHGNYKAEKNFLQYAIYVIFFPQLVAGPIERPAHLLPQFRETHEPDYPNISLGIQQMLRGFFKKMVIADNIAPYVDTIYSHPTQWHGNATLIGCYLFAIQIYCDFSGYSDIAIGAARVLGFRLMKNFNFPYRSTTLREFWRRWHISLSTWFRDYLYIPVAKNKRSWNKWGRIFAINVTFLVSGLWHGANITFVLWGLLHGLWMSFETVMTPFISKLRSVFEKRNLGSFYGWLGNFFTFHVVCFLWIFFRSKDVNTAFSVIRSLGFHPISLLQDAQELVIHTRQNNHYLLMPYYILVSLLVYLLIEWMSRHKDISLRRLPRPVYIAAFYILIGWIALLGAYQNAPDFIYFQF